MNDCLLLELNVQKFNDLVEFAQSLKKIVISSVYLNQLAFIVISDNHLQDPAYIDFCYTFISNLHNSNQELIYDK